MAGFVSLLHTGQVLLRLSQSPRPWHPVAEASGGVAVVLFVLVWWPQTALLPTETRPPMPAEPNPRAQPGSDTRAPRPTIIEPAAPAPRRADGKPGGSTTSAPKPPGQDTALRRWTVKQVMGKRLMFAGDVLPDTGRLRLIVPGDDRTFVSAVECRIEEASNVCTLIQMPGNAAPSVGDVFVLSENR